MRQSVSGSTFRFLFFWIVYHGYRSQHCNGLLWGNESLLCQIKHKILIKFNQKKGDLKKEVIDKKRKIPNEQIYEWSCEMIEGMYYLHSNRIIHRDIKPSYITHFFSYFRDLKFILFILKEHIFNQWRKTHQNWRFRRG